MRLEETELQLSLMSCGLVPIVASNAQGEQQNWSRERQPHVLMSMYSCPCPHVHVLMYSCPCPHALEAESIVNHIRRSSLSTSFQSKSPSRRPCILVRHRQRLPENFPTVSSLRLYPCFHSVDRETRVPASESDWTGGDKPPAKQRTVKNAHTVHRGNTATSIVSRLPRLDRTAKSGPSSPKPPPHRVVGLT